MIISQWLSLLKSENALDFQAYNLFLYSIQSTFVYMISFHLNHNTVKKVCLFIIIPNEGASGFSLSDTVLKTLCGSERV